MADNVNAAAAAVAVALFQATLLALSRSQALLLLARLPSLCSLSICCACRAQALGELLKCPTLSISVQGALAAARGNP